VSAYRFCRTDDIALLVDALNRCWAPHVAGEPPMTVATFKRTVRDLQVWCSSCMVAFSGMDPIGVLIGAKRASATLVHRIAVHPEYRRQGHGRHLLTSLGSKLAILGPSRIVAEVPATCPEACAFFAACGYVEEAVLTDYVLEQPALALRTPPGHAGTGRDPREGRAAGEGVVIPVTVGDLAANGLFDEAWPPVCWERSVETLLARQAEIAGLAIATDERIEAYLLYVTPEVPPGGTSPMGSPGTGTQGSSERARQSRTAEVLALRACTDNAVGRLYALLSWLSATGYRTIRFPKVSPEEISAATLAALGFRPVATHRRYAATARPG